VPGSSRPLAATMALTSYRMFSCVSTTPFGGPVVPEVKMIVRGSSGLTVRQRNSQPPAAVARRFTPSHSTDCHKMIREPRIVTVSSRTMMSWIPDASIAGLHRARSAMLSTTRTDGEPAPTTSAICSDDSVG
jgi:hypothetical protein